MATDGPDPKPCDQEVFKSGKQAFITHSIPSNAFDRWVEKVAELSGQRVDWHFCGGRAVVLFLGDESRVLAALREMMPEHDKLKTDAIREILGE